MTFSYGYLPTGIYSPIKGKLILTKCHNHNQWFIILITITHLKLPKPQNKVRAWPKSH